MPAEWCENDPEVQVEDPWDMGPEGLEAHIKWGGETDLATIKTMTCQALVDPRGDLWVHLDAPMFPWAAVLRVKVAGALVSVHHLGSQGVPLEAGENRFFHVSL